MPAGMPSLQGLSGGLPQGQHRSSHGSTDGGRVAPASPPDQSQHSLQTPVLPVCLSSLLVLNCSVLIQGRAANYPFLKMRKRERKPTFDDNGIVSHSLGSQQPRAVRTCSATASFLHFCFHLPVPAFSPEQTRQANTQARGHRTGLVSSSQLSEGTPRPSVSQLLQVTMAGSALLLKQLPKDPALLLVGSPLLCSLPRSGGLI